MYQGLVLVDIRSRSMAQSCIPGVRVRRTAAGAPHRQELLHPQKAASRIQNSGAGMTLDESTGSALKKTVAPGPDWLLCRALAKPRVSFSPTGCPCPVVDSSRGAVPEKQRICHSVLDLPVSLIYTWYWALLELVVSASCVGNTSAIDCPEALCSPTRKAPLRQLFGTMVAMASSEPLCV